jgi:hypothetical protein
MEQEMIHKRCLQIGIVRLTRARISKMMNSLQNYTYVVNFSSDQRKEKSGNLDLTCRLGYVIALGYVIEHAQ